MKASLSSVALLAVAAFFLGGCDSQPLRGVQSVFTKSDGPWGPRTDSQASTRESQITARAETSVSGQTAAQQAARSKGRPELDAGIKSYEDGKYSEAAAKLQTAITAGLTTSDETKAHKYLAFIHCVSKREKQCRTEFRKALDITPTLELDAAEADHPMWGPVFRSVKGRG